jgi:hypothetical protein
MDVIIGAGPLRWCSPQMSPNVSCRLDKRRHTRAMAGVMTICVGWQRRRRGWAAACRCGPAPRTVPCAPAPLR